MKKMLVFQEVIFNINKKWYQFWKPDYFFKYYSNGHLVVGKKTKIIINK